MKATPISKAALRPMLPADLDMLAAIFEASIEELTDEDYDEGQREAWASVARDEAAFGVKLAGMLTLVATLQSAPVGFISLAGADRIDMLYVHPAVTRRGIASLLYDAVEKLARGRGATKLMADVSDTAMPFFQMKGFQPRHRQTVTIGGEWLGNTRMEREI